MILQNPERYNFYKVENKLKKGISKFVDYLDELLKLKGIDAVINALKASGLPINMFNDQKQGELFNEVLEQLSPKLNERDKSQIQDLKMDALLINNVLKNFSEIRDKYFESKIKDDKYNVVSYLISLELYLKNILHETNKVSNDTEINKRASAFDTAIESTGMILKNFMYQNCEFVGSKRNISPKIITAASKHLLFSNIWNELNDIIEYWKYSDVNISITENKVLFEIKDSLFELNNLISNDRFNNLRDGWQASKLGETFREGKLKAEDEIFSQVTDNLTYLFASLYFGSPLLDEEIEGIAIEEWIRAYQLLIKESKKFLKNQSEKIIYNLEKNSLCKNVYDWERFFKNNGYSEKDTKTIIQTFTFNKKSLDLVDCPFIKVDNYLIIIPSLTAEADPSRALASNFLNNNFNLEFKGKGFEDRIKACLSIGNIQNQGLYKKTDKTEYECDVAYVIGNDLFFVECKAHVQPFTTRQHANHLKKLYDETNQLNRIADFFESNVQIVKEQLGLDANFIPNQVYRILLTTSMIGSPLYINGVYIVDESAFSKFINRNPPTLQYFDKDSFTTVPSTKFDIYEGEITTNKLLRFLKDIPQIRITKDFYIQREISLELFSIKRNVKNSYSYHVGDLNTTDKLLINKYY